MERTMCPNAPQKVQYYSGPPPAGASFRTYVFVIGRSRIQTLGSKLIQTKSITLSPLASARLAPPWIAGGAIAMAVLFGMIAYGFIWLGIIFYRLVM